jgi:predicted transcriptional regulator
VTRQPAISFSISLQHHFNRAGGRTLTFGIMHLTPCQDQKKQTLDEFYTEVTTWENAGSRDVGRVMLGLIARLRALPDERRVFGLTSHLRLCLLASDSYRSPWYVIVSALDERNIHVEYLMPKTIAPWPHAYVRGDACSEDEAVQMILTAIEKSEGWS